MTYDSNHPGLRLLPFDADHLSLYQHEHICRLHDDGWRQMAGFPVLQSDGALCLHSMRREPGGPDDEGVVWHRTEVVTIQGQILDPQLFDE